MADTELKPCPRKCVVCVDSDHHWLPDTDQDEFGDRPILVCKHCEVTREVTDDDEY
jgi:hypothetical protein